MQRRSDFRNKLKLEMNSKNQTMMHFVILQAGPIVIGCFNIIEVDCRDKRGLGADVVGAEHSATEHSNSRDIFVFKILCNFTFFVVYTYLDLLNKPLELTDLWLNSVDHCRESFALIANTVFQS